MDLFSERGFPLQSAISLSSTIIRRREPERAIFRRANWDMGPSWQTLPDVVN